MFGSGEIGTPKLPFACANSCRRTLITRIRSGAGFHRIHASRLSRRQQGARCRAPGAPLGSPVPAAQAYHDELALVAHPLDVGDARRLDQLAQTREAVVARVELGKLLGDMRADGAEI